MTTANMIPGAIKTHGGRRPGAGRKPTPRPPAPVPTLAEAWRQASDDERRAFVREHRGQLAIYP